MNILPEKSKIPIDAGGQRVDVTALKNYYDDGMKILHRLYAEIANSFIEQKNRSDLANDTQSVLTT